MTKFDAIVSEFLNASILFPDIAWLTLLGIYLAREAKRRDLHPLDWFSLPPSMGFVIAVFVGDVASLSRALGVFFWTKQGGGAFSPAQLFLFQIAAALAMLGFLCKIRAWTLPDHGHAPWLTAAAGSVVVVAVLWWTR